jgi:HlyD family secretion protein
VSVKPTKRAIGLLALATIVTLVGAGVWRWNASTDGTAAQPLVLYGNVDIRQVNLAFNGSEHVVSMLAQEGQAVSKDQLLATLHADRLTLAVSRARAQFEAQQSIVAALQAGTRPEEISKARADVAAAAAEAKNADLNAQRIKDLAAKKLASTEQADNAIAAQAFARAKLNAAQATLTLAIAGPRNEDIQAAKSTLMALHAELDLTQQALEDANLYAPADGVIQNRILEVGDMASPQTPVYTLALMNPVWVRAYVAEPDVGKLRPGMLATIATDSFPEKRYEGWIGYISPTAQFTPKSVETARARTDLVYEVRVFACNQLHELRLGMPATVSVALNQPIAKDNLADAPCTSP